MSSGSPDIDAVAVDFRNRRVWLHRVVIDHRELELVLDDLVCLGKTLLHVALDQFGLKTNVSLGEVVHQRRSICHRFINTDHRGELFVFHANLVQRLLGCRTIDRCHGGNRLTGENHPLYRDDWMILVFAAPGVGTDVAEIFACYYGDDSGHRFRFAGIDGSDARVRVGAAQELAFDHARNDQIAGIARLARDFIDAVDARNGRSNARKIACHCAQASTSFQLKESRFERPSKKDTPAYNEVDFVSRIRNRQDLSTNIIDAMLCLSHEATKRNNLLKANHILFLIILSVLFSCLAQTSAQVASTTQLVELVPIDVDPKHPQRKDFGSLTLLSAFQLKSADKRFGGLSGLAIGADGRFYAVSDNGFWVSARMTTGANGALSNLVDWRIASLLSRDSRPVTGALRDAEALAVERDGSFLVGFEGAHRIWRHSAPPNTFDSTPSPVQIPSLSSQAPSNGGIEGLTVLPDGRLLILTEELANVDGSFKGWLSDNGRTEELSYVPAKGFHVTDCAALNNGDVLVLERRYVPLGILSARLTLVKADRLRAGARLVGKELLKLEQPLAAENFEGIAVQQTKEGTIIYIVSDDNYSPFQQTLLLQFILPDAKN